MNDLPLERVEVVGLDRIYLSVSDFVRAEQFYDVVFGLLDFRKSDFEIAGDPHRHYFNKVMQISIRPARTKLAHDPYAPGLHHLGLQAADNDAVDRIAELLANAAIETTRPAFYPEYADDYYAIFFRDPDGFRFEIVARRVRRKRIVAQWEMLKTFLNPVVKPAD